LHRTTGGGLISTVSLNFSDALFHLTRLPRLLRLWKNTVKQPKVLPKGLLCDSLDI